MELMKLTNKEAADVIMRTQIQLGRMNGKMLLSSALLKAVEVLREAPEWIPVSERLPEGKTDSHTNDFEIVLCTTIWEDVRPYKFGKPIGHEKSHFWHIGEIMDEYVIAWMPLPKPYEKEGESDADS